MPDKKTDPKTHALSDQDLHIASGGVIESVGVKYTMFNPDGTPVRAASQSVGIHSTPSDNLKQH